jgi:hypothetical protein
LYETKLRKVYSQSKQVSSNLVFFCESHFTLRGGTFKTFFAGDYAVIVSKDGCRDTSGCYTFDIVDKLENTFEREMSISPNPASGYYFISLGREFPYLDVMVTDLEGRLVQQNQYHHVSTIELLLSAPQGIYLLKISSGDTAGVFRIVKN